MKHLRYIPFSVNQRSTLVRFDRTESPPSDQELGTNFLDLLKFKTLNDTPLRAEHNKGLSTQARYAPL